MLNTDLCNDKSITLEFIEGKGIHNLMSRYFKHFFVLVLGFYLVKEEKYLFLDNDSAQFCSIKDFSFEMISKILELGPCQPQPEELLEKIYPKKKGK